MTSPFTHARRDADGLLVALLNTVLAPDVVQQPYVHPAPRGALAPGHCWRWHADIDDWVQIPDPRGTEYVQPGTGERLVITHPLQQPPAGWELAPDSGQRVAH